MATYIIKTPDIGEGIAEVELVAWHVKPGDTVAMDQVLADVMTDKATVEVPSPVAGTVLALGGTPGQTVAVGAELVRLEVEGKGNVKASAVAAPPPSPGALAPTIAATAMIAVASVLPMTEATPNSSDRPIASPAVRRRAWELGIDLATVQASGPAGRIVQADLDRHAAAYTAIAVQQPIQAKPATALPVQAAVGQVDVGTEDHSQVSIPVIGLRRKIAIRMQDAKRRIPHFTYVEEIDVTELERLRARLNEQWGVSRGKLTLLPMLVRAMALAIREFPQVNARFDDNAGVVTRFGAVDVGIATQTDNGLLVPVLRQAQSRDLWGNALEIARLAQAARSGRSTREELSGSTITVTSLGVLGGIVSTPVINTPEVAIIGVNRIVERPMIVNGAVVARKMMNLSSSFDHRVVDGVDAAQFVQAIRQYLELPATLFVQ